VQTLPAAVLARQPLPDFAEMPVVAPGNPEKALRGQLCEFVHRAYRQRLLISTAGAFSARLEGNDFLVTPRRRDRLELEAPGIVRARPGFCEAGKRPSRAALLHAHIYQRNPDVGAVINAQPAHASAFCMTKAALSSNTIPESYLVLRDVPKLPFACIVEDAARLAAQVSLKKCPVVLIENEGAVVVGKDVLDAFDRLEVLEATAEAMLLSRPLGPAGADAEGRARRIEAGVRSGVTRRFDVAAETVELELPFEAVGILAAEVTVRFQAKFRCFE
jgi:L-fuculose-phosphate aldolase